MFVIQMFVVVSLPSVNHEHVDSSCIVVSIAIHIPANSPVMAFLLQHLVATVHAELVMILWL
jgi:hypothetical protein